MTVVLENTKKTAKCVFDCGLKKEKQNEKLQQQLEHKRGLFGGYFASCSKITILTSKELFKNILVFIL